MKVKRYITIVYEQDDFKNDDVLIKAIKQGDVKVVDFILEHYEKRIAELVIKKFT